MVEISGRENKIEAFIEQMRPFGILEMVRTGRIAMLRDDAFTVEGTGECAGPRPRGRIDPEFRIRLNSLSVDLFLPGLGPVYEKIWSQKTRHNKEIEPCPRKSITTMTPTFRC